MTRSLKRRRFLSLPAVAVFSSDSAKADFSTLGLGDRRQAALRIRQSTAMAQDSLPAISQRSNSDESVIPRWASCFTKGLPTTQSGEAEPGAYETLLRAIESGKHADFERISRGSGRRFVSPQASYAFSLEGGDSHCFACPPAPAFSSAEFALEMTEMYWLSLTRDVPFREYAASPVILEAARELKTTPRAVFRGSTNGDLDGPYISQFLARPRPSVSTMFEQRYRIPLSGSDFMTTYSEWLQIQNGVPPWRDYTWDATTRYIRNGRDLAEWVHYDCLYEAFLNAALILMNYRPESTLNETRSVWSEKNPYKYSKVQDGFVTFGKAQVVDWVARVTTAALKAAWAQKWLVHRRLRPEAFAGRVHQMKTKTIEYPVHADLLNSTAVEETHRRFESYLLPQAYPEGSPIHPSYPGGHATVAGACSIVLKALFDENALMPDCVHASADGLSLEPCPSSFVPTIGNEINKLVFNIAMGRSWAGIHYRSDSISGMRLGEDVAISILQDLVQTCTEDSDGFAFTRFDGTPVKINRNGEVS